MLAMHCNQKMSPKQFRIMQRPRSASVRPVTARAPKRHTLLCLVLCLQIFTATQLHKVDAREAEDVPLLDGVALAAAKLPSSLRNFPYGLVTPEERAYALWTARYGVNEEDLPSAILPHRVVHFLLPDEREKIFTHKEISLIPFNM